MIRITPPRTQLRVPAWIVTILLMLTLLAACAAPTDTEDAAAVTPEPAAESATAEPVQATAG